MSWDDWQQAALKALALKAAEALEDARAAVSERNELIRQAVQEGATLRAVAEAAGISHTAVANIANR